MIWLYKPILGCLYKRTFKPLSNQPNKGWCGSVCLCIRLAVLFLSCVFFVSCFWWPTLHPPSLRVHLFLFLHLFLWLSFSVTSVHFLQSEKNVHKMSQEPDCYHWNCKSELANQKHKFCSFGFADLFLEHSGVLGKCVWLKFSKRLE